MPVAILITVWRTVKSPIIFSSKWSLSKWTSLMSLESPQCTQWRFYELEKNCKDERMLILRQIDRWLYVDFKLRMHCLTKLLRHVILKKVFIVVIAKEGFGGTSLTKPSLGLTQTMNFLFKGTVDLWSYINA